MLGYLAVGYAIIAVSLIGWFGVMASFLFWCRGSVFDA